MKNIKVGIGANWGDEGKGLFIDYLASKAKDGIVVRFNSGAQAGHTVVTPEGKRHVFGHFGSGTMVGTPTYLSSFFVVNPLLFRKESTDLEKEGVDPWVYMDKDCIVTTPYDMMINQIVEAHRGDAKHGSCGVGFNETIVRSESSGLKLIVSDLLDTAKARQKLDIIRKDYVYDRLLALGVKDIPEDFIKYFKSENIVDRYIEDIIYMLDMTETTDISILDRYESIIFEGAQGLMLDQGHKYFPHVTRSNTGMKNVRVLLKEAGLENEPIEITYITRAYLTRHGAGPFPTELSEKPYEKIVDLTNVRNAFQGSLRFGILDINLLAETIANDLGDDSCSIAITCLDQVGDKISYMIGDELYNTSIKDFIQYVQSIVSADRVYISSGPTRNTIVASEVSTIKEVLV